MTRSARILFLALCAAATCVTVLTAARYLNRPLRSDEADWAAQAQAIARHGVPRVGFSEERVQHIIGYFGYDAHYGMWHPPLYHHMLALGFILAGDHDWTYRAVGLLCLAITLLILWKLARDLAVPRAPPMLRLVPVALPVLSPLVLDGGLFVDIDGTVLTTAIALLLWRFLRPGDAYTPRRILELSLLFCLALLAKLTTPVVLMASLALYAALGARPVRGVLAVALAAAAGAGMFAVVYWGYCWALDYPAGFMWKVNYLGKWSMYGSIKTLRQLLFTARWNFVWVSPVMTVLIASVVIRRVRRYLRERVPEPLDLLVIFSSSTFICYVALGAMWGKYTVPAALVGAAAAGLELARAWPKLVVHRPAGVAAGLACLLAVVALAPVPHARLAAVPPGAGLVELAFDPRNVSAVLTAGVAVAFAIAAARRWMTAGPRWLTAEIALVTVLIVTAPVTAVRVVVPGGDSGPLRPSADRGFRETVEFLNGTMLPDAGILAPKDFGRYLVGRVYPLDDLLEAGGASLVAQVARRPDVSVVVDSSKYPLLIDGDIGQTLEIARVERIQDFRILVKRSPAPESRESR